MRSSRPLIILILVLLGLAGCAAYVAGPVPPPGGGPEVELSFFYDSLAPYGEWLWVQPWGWVWTPWDIEPGWRPYTDGRWLWTDLGWTWVSDQAWGWAPFHYGRWTYHDPHGWIWIPGTVWAPAWVAWRYGDGWIGWAPLPPDVRWRIGFGLDLGGIDLGVSILPHGWCFVGERDFLSPRVGRHAVPLPRNAHLIRETRDRTRYEERGNRVADHGPGVEEIEHQVGRPIERHPIVDVGQPPRRPAGEGGAVQIYRPEVRERPLPVKPTSKPTVGGTGEERPPAVRQPAPKPTKPRQIETALPATEGAPPAVKPATEGEARRREAQDLERLRAWQREQNRHLEEEQRGERQRPPAGVSAKELEERQKQEQQALGREVERERKVIENRKDRRSGKEKTPKNPPEQKPPV